MSNGSPAAGRFLVERGGPGTRTEAREGAWLVACTTSSHGHHLFTFFGSGLSEASRATSWVGSLMRRCSRRVDLFCLTRYRCSAAGHRSEAEE